MSARVKVSLAFQLSEEASIVRRKKVLSLQASDSVQRIYETISGRSGGPALWPKDFGQLLDSGQADARLFYNDAEAGDGGGPDLGNPNWQPARADASLGDFCKGQAVDLLLKVIELSAAGEQEEPDETVKDDRGTYYSRTFLHFKEEDEEDKQLTPRALSDPISHHCSTPMSRTSSRGSLGVEEQAEEEKLHRKSCEAYIQKKLLPHLGQGKSEDKTSKNSLRGLTSYSPLRISDQSLNMQTSDLSSGLRPVPGDQPAYLPPAMRALPPRPLALGSGQALRPPFPKHELDLGLMRPMDSPRELWESSEHGEADVKQTGDGTWSATLQVQPKSGEQPPPQHTGEPMEQPLPVAAETPAHPQPEQAQQQQPYVQGHVQSVQEPALGWPQISQAPQQPSSEGFGQVLAEPPLLPPQAPPGQGLEPQQDFHQPANSRSPYPQFSSEMPPGLGLHGQHLPHGGQHQILPQPMLQQQQVQQQVLQQQMQPPMPLPTQQPMQQSMQQHQVHQQQMQMQMQQQHQIQMQMQMQMQQQQQMRQQMLQQRSIQQPMPLDRPMQQQNRPRAQMPQNMAQMQAQLAGQPQMQQPMLPQMQQSMLPTTLPPMQQQGQQNQQMAPVLSGGYPPQHFPSQPHVQHALDDEEEDGLVFPSQGQGMSAATSKAEDLFDIVSRNDLPALRDILASPVDVNECTAKGSHVLFRAVIKARELDMIHMLLNAGADPRSTDDKGNQVMHFWARATVGRNYLLEMGRSLLLAGADVNAQRFNDGMSPLHHVVVGHNNRRGWLDFHKALMLVRHGANIHLRTHIGQLPLNLVNVDGRAATRKLVELLQYGIPEGGGGWPHCEQAECIWCS